VGFRWALGTSEAMNARLFDFGAAGALALDQPALWWAHAGLAAGGLVVTPRDPGIKGNGTTVVGSAWIGLSRLFRTGRVVWSIGPELRVMDRERTIALDGETVFELPQLSAGATVMIGF